MTTNQQEIIEIGIYAIECCSDVIFKVIGFWSGFMFTSGLICEHFI